MPIQLKKHIEPEGVWGLWNITEPEDFFLSKVDLRELEKAQFDQIRGHRRVEWLASRYLLHLLSERNLRGEVLKDEYGKPYLEGSEWQISLSHSHNLAGVAAAPYPIGIDVQRIVPKIERLANKYLSPREAAAIRYRHRLEYLHLYWCAKEAIYKAYGKKSLAFKTHIEIEPFFLKPYTGQMQGHLKKGEVLMDFDLDYEIQGSFFIVIAKAVESKRHP